MDFRFPSLKKTANIILFVWNRKDIFLFGIWKIFFWFGIWKTFTSVHKYCSECDKRCFDLFSENVCIEFRAQTGWQGIMCCFFTHCDKESSFTSFHGIFFELMWKACSSISTIIASNCVVNSCVSFLRMKISPLVCIFNWKKKFAIFRNPFVIFIVLSKI